MATARLGPDLGGRTRNDPGPSSVSESVPPSVSCSGLDASSFSVIVAFLTSMLSLVASTLLAILKLLPGSERYGYNRFLAPSSGLYARKRLYPYRSQNQVATSE